MKTLCFNDEKSFATYINKLGGKVYLVGGAVRDEIMGIESHDKDYVVVGMDVADMPLNRIVGTDFPVFLANIGGNICEIAMARAEQKCGVGYHGFTFKADKTVSIFDDLARRDLTINAIAKNVLTNHILDPYYGREDINNKILRHTTIAFCEDPLRVYRVARFAAKFNFSIDPATLALMREMRNELKTLKAERIWQELEKVLLTHNPRKFFEVLKDINVLDVHFKEIDALHVADAHDGTTFNHTMNLINMGNDPLERFGLLVHDIGKGYTGNENVLSYKHGTHNGHSKFGELAVHILCERLKTPNHYRDFGVICAKYHMRIKYIEMRPSKFFDMVLKLEPHIEQLLRISFIDSITRAHSNDEYMNILSWYVDSQLKINAALQVKKEVNGKSLIEQGFTPNQNFGQVLFQRRVEAFKEKLKEDVN